MSQSNKVPALIGFLLATLLAANVFAAVNRGAEESYRDKVIREYVQGQDGKDGSEGVVKTIIQQVPSNGQSGGPETIRYVVVTQPVVPPKEPQQPPEQKPPIIINTPPSPDDGEGEPVIPPTQPDTSVVCKLIGVCL